MKKAIKFFEEEITRLENAPKINGCEMTDEWAEQIEICKTAKSAIEKQTPKKVKRMPHISIHTERPFVFTTYHCPVCNATVNKKRPSWLFFKEAESHCYRCGQRLEF